MLAHRRSGISRNGDLAHRVSALPAAGDKPLAVELGPIRVNAVAPGVVDSSWWTGAGLTDEARRNYFARTAEVLPTRRVATAEEIAEAIVFAGTNANITGTVIEADGGMRLISMA